MRRLAAVTALPLAVLVLLTGCASDSRAKEVKAALFTEKARAAGVASGMTPAVAESLYGDDGGALCAALDGNPAGLLLGWGRATLTATPEEHADDLIAYDRLVVDVYCPDRLGAFGDLVGRVNR
ncbi:hypothetical protein [Streptomyces sp. NPDC094049]|uniref:hypothetical protein n=1 Tax=Streptomyces sp. NPDC094049 TaxID=3154987 RepID=UPI00331C1493